MRSWEVPPRPWIASQQWSDLAFLHVRVDGGQMAARLPRGLRLQEFDGSAWVSVVAFRLGALGFRALPSWCALAEFPELNVRTYVERDGKPGVWFLSLDAPRAVVVLVARAMFGLPYRLRDVRSRSLGGGSLFTSGAGPEDGGFSCSYSGDGIRRVAPEGSLEHFLLERYCLYSPGSRGRTLRVEVDHPPWEVEGLQIGDLDMGGLLSGLPLRPRPGEPLLGHFSRGVPVVSWSAEVCAG